VRWIAHNLVRHTAINIVAAHKSQDEQKTAAALQRPSSEWILTTCTKKYYITQMVLPGQLKRESSLLPFKRMSIFLIAQSEKTSHRKFNPKSKHCASMIPWWSEVATCSLVPPECREQTKNSPPTVASPSTPHIHSRCHEISQSSSLDCISKSLWISLTRFHQVHTDMPLSEGVTSLSRDVGLCSHFRQSIN